MNPMNTNEIPYIGRCDFCSQGLLRFMRCGNCGEICAVCDECELVWQDVAAVRSNPKAASSSSFPKCPACKKKVDDWQRLDLSEVEAAGVAEFVAGKSI